MVQVRDCVSVHGAPIWPESCPQGIHQNDEACAKGFLRMLGRGADVPQRLTNPSVRKTCLTLALALARERGLLVSHPSILH